MKPASEVNESLGNVFFWQLVYYGGLEGIETFMGILEYTGEMDAQDWLRKLLKLRVSSIVI